MKKLHYDFPIQDSPEWEDRSKYTDDCFPDTFGTRLHRLDVQVCCKTGKWIASCEPFFDNIVLESANTLDEAKQQSVRLLYAHLNILLKEVSLYVRN